MSSEDEEELPKPHASFAIPMSTAGIVLLLPVVLLHALNKREIRTRNTKFTKWLMIGVLASNGVNQSLFVLKCLFCGYCTVITGLWFSSKAIVKAVNLLFLIHRGKLVQGMNPILSKKWFEKILPTIIVVIICGFIFSILKSNANEDYTCTQYEDWNNGHTCVASAVRTSGGKGVAASAIGLDALITTFLMVLFIVPLYRVYNVDLGQMNHHQIRQRKKLKDLLIWSMVMTFINQVTSTFFLISIVHQSHVTNVLYLIGLFDPAINVWTAWLMVTSNRQYLRNLCCFMCSKYSEEREVRRQMSGLTNVPSRSATITSVKMSQVSVDIASAEMKVSEGDLLAQILPTGTKSRIQFWHQSNMARRGPMNAPDTGLREKRLPRQAREVQNKAPAPHQITAEQMVREAQEMQFEKQAAPPRQQITDPEELKMYKLRKRKKFENTLRRNRMSIGVWLKYAEWEESQKEFERSRSIFERIIDIDYQNPTIWLKYSEMEMRNRFVNRARNVWDRAVGLLPRVDQLWFKYALMEENLKNYEGARRVFERWMKWNPGEKAWMSYIALENRSIGSKADKMHRSRQIYDRFIQQHGDENAYIKYAEWEYKKSGSVDFARAIYEKALKALDEEELSPDFYGSFAKFEISCKEYERARAIYKHALDNVPKYRARDLFEEYMLFEKRYGNKQSIDAVIVNKKRFEYEQQLVEQEQDYDLWFDYIKLEEQNLAPKDENFAAIREIYERAIAQIPPIVTDKRYWKRYIYLWIKYAMFEELVTKQVDRARAVYLACLKVIPHENFTFGKMWVMFAEFELRQKRLDQARSILGEAIGRCPKKNIFNAYIGIEYQLGEFSRCRKIYQKLLETFPSDSTSWNDYALLENKLDEYERAKAIYEMGIGQEVLDEPQALWSNYIEFEVKRGHYEEVRTLFERLLVKTKHVRVWINFAQFEAQINEPGRARKVFERADQYFKRECEDEDRVEARVLLLEAHLQFEGVWGNEKEQQDIMQKQPTKIKKRRPIKTADGTEAGYEEYYDYRFPDDEKQKDSLNTLLERAKQWKMQQAKK